MTSGASALLHHQTVSLSATRPARMAATPAMISHTLGLPRLGVKPKANLALTMSAGSSRLTYTSPAFQNRSSSRSDPAAGVPARPSDEDEGLSVSAQACGGIPGVEVGAGPVGEGQQYDPQPGDVQLADQ